MKITPLDIKTADGTVIDANFIIDEAKETKAIVIVCHGFGEHLESYNELAQWLSQAGYASVVFNQRGHGESCLPGKKKKDRRGIIRDYRDFLDDIDVVASAARKQAPDVPIALYGHSMGGNIVSNYLLKNNQTDYFCAILESPWLGLSRKVGPFLSVVAKVLGAISPGIAIVNKLQPDDITSDSARLEMFEDDERYHNRISMRMFAGINNGCKYALENASSLSIPVYLAYAANERIVSNSAIKQFAGSTEKSTTVKEYDSCHAIHNDLIRETLYQDYIEYLDAHLAAKSQD